MCTNIERICELSSMMLTLGVLSSLNMCVCRAPSQLLRAQMAADSVFLCHKNAFVSRTVASLCSQCIAFRTVHYGTLHPIVLSDTVLSKDFFN